MIAKKQKAKLIIIGLVIALFLLETILRLAGFIYKAQRTRDNIKIAATEEQNIINILCLGDSFTFGLGSEYGNDYPAQLEKLLNANYQDRKFIVHNQGIPGQNSTMVLKRLPKNIKMYRPDMILLLIGSNNDTVLLKNEESNYYLFKKPGVSKIMNFFLGLDIALGKSRSYNLLRVTMLNLKNKFEPKVSLKEEQAQGKPEKAAEEQNVEPQKKASDNEDHLKLSQTLYDERKFSAAEEAIKENINDYGIKDKPTLFLLADIYIKQEKYDLAIATMEEYIKRDPKDSVAIFNLGKAYYLQGRNEPSVKKDRFELAIKMFEESLLYVGPDDLNLKGEIYSYLARLFFDEGKNELAQKMIESALKYRPQDVFFQQFLKMILNASLKRDEKEIFRKLLFYDVGNIISLCRMHDIRIIILNYPSEKKNCIREEAAEKYNVPFINIGSKFSELLFKGNYKDLFSNDGNHPNAKGYRVMAETVFDALKPEIGKLQ